MPKVDDRFANMTPAEKMIEALKGDRETRLTLVRDPNRVVFTAVMSSPGLTIMDVESIASMTDVAPAVLRRIGSVHDWTKYLSVRMKLVLNPMTPSDIVMNLMPSFPDEVLLRLTKLQDANERVRLIAHHLLRSRGVCD